MVIKTKNKQMTKLEAIQIAKSVQVELNEFVDCNTKGKSRAAACFTKNTAENLKAGYADGIGSLIRALDKAGAFK